MRSESNSKQLHVRDGICVERTRLEGLAVFPPAPWIRGRVTQPKHALTCSPHSWRAGIGGGACNTTPPLINNRRKRSSGLCPHSLHSQHASSLDTKRFRLKLGRENEKRTRLKQSLSPELRHELKMKPDLNQKYQPQPSLQLGFSFLLSLSQVHCTETINKCISADTRTFFSFSIKYLTVPKIWAI